MTNLSIVIPCYNEGKKLKENLKSLVNFLKDIDINYEIIVVNDGSKDKTIEELESFKPEEFNVTNLKAYEIVSYNENKGKGYAVKKGISKAKGQYVIFMDADFSTDIGEIIKFWEKREEADILIGNRKQSHSNIENKSILRKFISFVFNSITKLIIPIEYKDTQCGFKFFKTDIAKDIIKKQKINRFAFDIEYLYISKLNGYKVKDLPVNWKDDKDSQVKILSSSINMLRDLIKIRMNKKNYINKKERS